jgi:hypothetical protein
MKATIHCCRNLRAMLLLLAASRWDYNIPGMVDAAKSLADLQAKGLIKQVKRRKRVTSMFPPGHPQKNKKNHQHVHNSISMSIGVPYIQA